MITDIHTHNFAGRTADVLKEAAANKIDRIVLLGDVLRHCAAQSAEQVRAINDDTLNDVRNAGGYACGFCYLNPLLEPEFLEEEMARCLSLDEFRGIKLEISVCCRDKSLDLLMATAIRYDVPVLQHTWYKTVNKYPGESDPSDVAALARRFPEAKIIMAHLCGCGVRGIEDIADCPNVTVDTSGGQPEAGLVEFAVRRIGSHRLVYGSDAPCREFGTQIAKVMEADISDADKEAIFYKNSSELLKW